LVDRATATGSKGIDVAASSQPWIWMWVPLRGCDCLDDALAVDLAAERAVALFITVGGFYSLWHGRDGHAPAESMVTRKRTSLLRRRHLLHVDLEVAASSSI